MEIHTARMHPLLDRRLDCGAGGFSDLVNSAFTSKFPINAGEELFISYGEHWLEYREAFNDVPLSENFDESDQIAASVWSMLHLEGASIPNTTVAPFLRTIQDVLVSEHRTKMALNNVLDLHSLKRLVERNGTAKMTVNARSNDWLEDNGFCLDNCTSGFVSCGHFAFECLIAFSFSFRFFLLPKSTSRIARFAKLEKEHLHADQ
jgi:hypothetical protein